MGRLLCAVLVVLMLTNCNCNLGPICRGMDTFNRELEGLKFKLAKMDSSFLQNISSAKKSLQNDLNQYIQRQVKEAMAGFRCDESLPKVRSPRVGTELRRLKQGQQMMKRQLSSMRKSVREVTKEKEMCRDAYFEAERKAEMTETCSQCGRDNTLMKSVIKHCKRLTVKSFSGNDVNSKAKPVQQTRVMKKLLITELTRGKMMQLSLHNNILIEHTLEFTNISSLCFIQKLGKLLIGTFSPIRIMSTSLDGKDHNMLRAGVLAKSMAVDEGRELVFMTTMRPEYSISRISTRGDKFTVIQRVTDETMNIAVNAREREVYASSLFSGMLRLSYDGKVLRKLTSGATHGLSFHGEGNVLYFNNGRTLKKVTLSDEVVSDVTTLDVAAATLAYYNNTVYYGGVARTQYVGAVQLGEKMVNTKLAQVDYSDALLICLVP